MMVYKVISGTEAAAKIFPALSTRYLAFSIFVPQYFRYWGAATLIFSTLGEATPIEIWKVRPSHPPRSSSDPQQGCD